MKGFVVLGHVVTEETTKMPMPGRTKMDRALLCGVLAFAMQLPAFELNGTWEGSFDITAPGGRAHPDRCYMQIERSRTRITGTVGPDRRVQWKIQNGKSDGKRITFEARPPEGGRLAFDLRVEGDRILGEVRGENQGLTIHAKVNLTKATH